MAKAAKIEDVKRPPRLAPPNSRPIIVSDRSGPAVDPMIAGGDTTEKKEPTPPPTLSHTAKTITPLSAPSGETPSGGKPVPDTPKPPQPEVDGKPAGGSPAAVITPVAVLKKEAATGTAPVIKTGDDTDADKEAAEPASAVLPQPEKAKPQIAPSEPAAQPEQPADKASAPAAAPDASNPAPTAQASADKPANAIDELARDPEAATKAQDNAVEEAKAKREAELEQIIASRKYEVPINVRAKKRSRLHALLFSLLALLLTIALVDAVLDEGLVRPPAGIPHTHFFSK